MERRYELMEFITPTTAEYNRTDKIDSEPMVVGDAREVIRSLLRSDNSVSGYKLVKRRAKR